MAANTSSRNRDVIKFPSPRPCESQVVRVVPPWKWRQPGGIRQRFVSTVSRWVKCEWGGCSVRWFHLLIALRLARRWRDFFQCWRRPHLEGVMGLTWSGGVVARARARGLNLVPRLSPLVATGHVTTQNLGGKKISSSGEVTECLVFWCDKLWISKPRSEAKNYPLYWGLKSNRLSFTAKIRQQNGYGAKTFWRLAHDTPKI